METWILALCKAMKFVSKGWWCHWIKNWLYNTNQITWSFVRTMLGVALLHTHTPRFPFFMISFPIRTSYLIRLRTCMNPMYSILFSLFVVYIENTLSDKHNIFFFISFFVFLPRKCSNFSWISFLAVVKHLIEQAQTTKRTDIVSGDMVSLLATC